MRLDAASFSIDVEHFALITYRVPADRVRRHLPERYELQTVTAGDGEDAFVSATCFCNRDFRLTALGMPRHTFNENTFRTYIHYQGTNAVFFLARYLSSSLATASQRVFDRHVYQADFDVTVEQRVEGYANYECNSSGPLGEVSFTLDAEDAPQPKAPFDSGNEHAQFITYRLDGHFKSTLGFPGHCPVSHARLRPYGGRLRDGRFEVWEELGILSAEEAEHPYSVLVAPGTRFLLYPPRPAF